jgi:hypothetical protein
MFCIHCGKELADGSKFCKFCGKNLGPETSPSPWTPAQSAPPEEPTYYTPPPYIPDKPAFAPPPHRAAGGAGGLVALGAALVMLAGAVVFTLSRFEVVDWFDGEGASESVEKPDSEDKKEPEEENPNSDRSLDLGALFEKLS